MYGINREVIESVIATAYATSTKVTFDIYEDHIRMELDPKQKPQDAVETPEARRPKPETPEKKPIRAAKQIDHGRIVALYTANPPRTVSWIADDMGISKQTVINHLKHEGIYKKEADHE